MLLLITAFLSGLVFGAGLLVSGMANPAKVLGFLDLAGLWDPSLVFVMLGAIAISLLAFLLARKRTTSLCGVTMQLPRATRLDLRLILGSVTFGIGWGIAGICPGPALVLLGSGRSEAGWFVGAMLAGMVLFEWLEKFSENRRVS